MDKGVGDLEGPVQGERARLISRGMDLRTSGLQVEAPLISRMDLLDQMIQGVGEKVARLEEMLPAVHGALYGPFHPTPSPDKEEEVDPDTGRVGLMTRNLTNMSERLCAMCELVDSLAQNNT